MGSQATEARLEMTNDLLTALETESLEEEYLSGFSPHDISAFLSQNHILLQILIMEAASKGDNVGCVLMARILHILACLLNEFQKQQFSFPLCNLWLVYAKLP